MPIRCPGRNRWSRLSRWHPLSCRSACRCSAVSPVPASLSTVKLVQDNLGQLMRVVSGIQSGDVVSVALDLGAVLLPASYQQYVAPAKSAYRAAISKNPSEAVRALQLFAPPTSEHRLKSHPNRSSNGSMLNLRNWRQSSTICSASPIAPRSQRPRCMPSPEIKHRV